MKTFLYRWLVMVVVICSSIVYASNKAPTSDEVTKLYVATFNRAPDSSGLTYWLKSGLTLEEIAQSFFDQKETQELYPNDTDITAFVEAVYQNLFNREPDDDGLIYWTHELISQNITKNMFILAVINGALGDDAVILENKKEVGLAFANAGLNDVEDAINVMSKVTADPSSVTQAKEYIASQNTNGTNWYEVQPDGYFSWQEANEWCTSRGYRLPYMSELIDVWNSYGGIISPPGFEKDTFYWALESAGSDSHKGCAMDYDCSKEDAWRDNSYGHPKCVIPN